MNNGPGPLSPSEPAAQDPSTSPSWIDFERARELWPRDSTFRRCLAEFLRREADCIATLRAQPTDQWVRRVHKLKGSAMVLALTPTAEQAAQLEHALREGLPADTVWQHLEGLDQALSPALESIQTYLST